ncbi:MAG: glutamyl-tRNA reductase [Planctomycetaceae bacterium]|nr:glutamyl-tRNA reductase [Planctomycetaceae bacterium]
MHVRVVGCSHHNSSVELREQLAFSATQVIPALAQFRSQFPQAEVVLLSTCNRVELYTTVASPEQGPSAEAMRRFLAEFHGLDPVELGDMLFVHDAREAIRHLFKVAASMDSMVVGEPQILAQVKQAYQLSLDGESAGPAMHAVFQAANRVAKRVATETPIHRKRVSIPSVAVGDFARGFFERFERKQILVIGAGEMAEETLRYLIDEGVCDITIVNRNRERSDTLVQRTAGNSADWEQLFELLIRADLVVSTTGASEPIIRLEDFQRVAPGRFQRLLFILDLAVPRDFDPRIGDEPNVYLYSIDDLAQVCDENRRQRQHAWPAAEKIVDQEVDRLMTELHHRATGPAIRQLRAQAEHAKDEELLRLMNKLHDADERTRQEINQFADRLVNKLLHPPLESLRDESLNGTPQGLLDALKRLFQIRD